MRARWNRARSVGRLSQISPLGACASSASARAHPRGLSAHPAVLPLSRRYDGRRRPSRRPCGIDRREGGPRRLSGERIRAELLLLLAAPRAVPAMHAMRRPGSPRLDRRPGRRRPTRPARRHRDGARAGPRPAPAARRLPPAPGVSLQSSCGFPRPRRRGSRRRTWPRRLLAREPRARGARLHLSPRRQAFVDGALMAWAASGGAPADAARARRVRITERWRAPEPPVRGPTPWRSAPPPGQRLAASSPRSDWWIAQGFPADRGRAREKLGELFRS